MRTCPVSRGPHAPAHRDRPGPDELESSITVGLAVTLLWTMKIRPSPKPETSACTLGLLKNRMVEALLGCCGELL
jgi:hypothetical protein